MGGIGDFGSSADGTPRQAMPCRLAAIIVGAISGDAFAAPANGEKTQRRIKRIERELVEPSILDHHGTLVKSTTDGFVATFDNPVEAARCSVIIRQGIVERNQSLPGHPCIEYRIGVNLGDVVTDPNDVYGDGVYAASGLAAIAGPGQVCISGGVYEQIKQKLFYAYEPLGDRKVENIAGPVTVYRMHPEPDALHDTGRRREIILMVLLSLTLLVIAGGIWYLLGQPAAAASPKSVTHWARPETTASSFDKRAMKLIGDRLEETARRGPAAGLHEVEAGTEPNAARSSPPPI